MQSGNLQLRPSRWSCPQGSTALNRGVDNALHREACKGIFRHWRDRGNAPIHAVPDQALFRVGLSQSGRRSLHEFAPLPFEK